MKQNFRGPATLLVDLTAATFSNSNFTLRFTIFKRSLTIAPEMFSLRFPMKSPSLESGDWLMTNQLTHWLEFLR